MRMELSKKSLLTMTLLLRKLQRGQLRILIKLPIPINSLFLISKLFTIELFQRFFADVFVDAVFAKRALFIDLSGKKLLKPFVSRLTIFVITRVTTRFLFARFPQATTHKLSTSSPNLQNGRIRKKSVFLCPLLEWTTSPKRFLMELAAFARVDLPLPPKQVHNAFVM